MNNQVQEKYFAVVGDVHGNMNLMVKVLADLAAKLKIQFDYVLQVGDFEPHRNEDDVATMAAPSKYRKLGDFVDFYTQKRLFPWPIYFIGGNHEPYGVLDNFPHGTKIIENCYYLGRVGKIDILDLTIAGLSGIYVADKFTQPRPAVSEIDKKSNKEYIYFTDEEVDRVLQYGKLDILMLHEWPTGIIDKNDQLANEELRHALIASDIGNEYSRLIIEIAEPQLVLCGHMHKSYRKKICLASGKTVNICCVANMEQEINAIAIFKVYQNNITEIII